ncbi:exodeoxyribonuclease VII small subunit [Sporolactobacillus sp. CPB3-1]|uniref:Exodeoxyribonuclease 7 small subunit n=1 Tax=Sporolactobacillus mangiferae TaxID=2940498 RepID=A0ABT0MD28_9BACL|nr:exodeoxyribonuclease VII small subunit [Sporolactobacillus mangiferae]MCL1632573.1 exodeoxyribonuclease VII small subunit [Sporolactobacillus mangiferae]
MSEQAEENSKELAFEEAMENLEQIVKQLEESDVPLEKAIGLFQKGMALSKLCHEKLQSVEKQMDRLIGTDGNPEPFSVQGNVEQ